MTSKRCGFSGGGDCIIVYLDLSTQLFVDRNLISEDIL